MSLVYRGTSSDDVHFNVTERRVYNAPAFDVTGIEVPGRSGDVLNSQERFKNKSIVYTGFIRSSDFPGDTTWERLSRGLRTIKAWVCGDAGKYHDLTDDYDPGFVRRAFVSGETAISEVLDRPDGATITITFMAEPFMYEESDPIELPETDTASGAIASFEGVAAPLQSLKFSIEPSQSGSGDPSPTNIRPISGWSQVDGARAGDNLMPGFDSGLWGTADTTGWTISNFSPTPASFPFDMPAGKYTGVPAVKVYLRGGVEHSISASPGKYWCISYYDGSGNKISNGASGWGLGVFTPPVGTAYAIFGISNYQGTATTLTASTQVQIAIGSSLPAWTAYKDTTPITISLGQTVYGGTVDALNGKLVIDYGIATLDTSSITGTISTSGWYFGYTFPSPMDVNGVTSTSAFDGIASACKPAQQGINWVNTTDATIGYWYAAQALRIKDGAADQSLDGYRARYNGMQVVYKLATPIEIDLTPVSVNSLLGQNNIWANTGNTEVVYVEPTENPTEWPSKPRLEITMAGAGTLTVNGKTWSIGAYTGTLICDSEIMDWYDASNLKNSLVSGDGFPELVPGENVITYTGGITKVVAKPRWRTL